MARKKKEEPPRIGLVTLKEAVATVMGRGEVAEEAAGEEGYSALRSERPVETYEEGRKCQRCGASLNRYNDSRDKLCSPCDAAIEKWKLFPMCRSDHEREMAPHCLRYVAEKLTKGKRVSNAVGGEVSGGSWARATGRKMPKKK